MQLVGEQIRESSDCAEVQMLSAEVGRVKSLLLLRGFSWRRPRRQRAASGAQRSDLKGDRSGETVNIIRNMNIVWLYDYPFFFYCEVVQSHTFQCFISSPDFHCCRHSRWRLPATACISTSPVKRNEEMSGVCQGTASDSAMLVFTRSHV